MGNEMTVADRMRKHIQSPAVMEQFRVALPAAGITTERFVRMALTAFTRDPSLYECTPESVLSCLVQAAQSGLSPSGISGECYLVKFNNRKKGVAEAQFIPGYRGLMKVARRSGHVNTIMAEVVRAGDDFEYLYGKDERLRHVPSGDEEAPMTHAYAYAHLSDGGFQFVVMTAAAVLKVKASSKSARSDYGPWVDHEPEMWKKTAIRRLCKMLPLSDDDYRLVEAATLEESGKDSWEPPATPMPAAPAAGATSDDVVKRGRGRPKKTEPAPVDAEFTNPVAPEPEPADAAESDGSDDLDLGDLTGG